MEATVKDPSLLPRLALPALARVRQKLADDRLSDVRGQVRQRLIDSGYLDSLRRGSTVAITAGSRGMGGFVELLAGVVDAVKTVGASPFIIPAMGSHGGATGEGQAEILRLLRVTEDAVGAPVRATMEVRALGISATGATAYIDELAAQADGIIVLGRTQRHPENTQGIASGLLKMVTVGLGKQPGAQAARSHELWPSVESVPKVTLAKSKVVAGPSPSIHMAAFRETIPTDSSLLDFGDGVRQNCGRVAVRSYSGPGNRLRCVWQRWQGEPPSPEHNLEQRQRAHPVRQGNDGSLSEPQLFFNSTCSF